MRACGLRLAILTVFTIAILGASPGVSAKSRLQAGHTAKQGAVTTLIVPVSGVESGTTGTSKVHLSARLHGTHRLYGTLRLIEHATLDCNPARPRCQAVISFRPQPGICATVHGSQTINTARGRLHVWVLGLRCTLHHAYELETGRVFSDWATGRFAGKQWVADYALKVSPSSPGGIFTRDISRQGAQERGIFDDIVNGWFCAAGIAGSVAGAVTGPVDAGVIAGTVTACTNFGVGVAQG